MLGHAPPFTSGMRTIKKSESLKEGKLAIAYSPKLAYTTCKVHEVKQEKLLSDQALSATQARERLYFG